MTARRPKKSAGSRKAKAASRRKPTRPALGNDPFERGAAVREPAPVAAVEAQAQRAPSDARPPLPQEAPPSLQAVAPPPQQPSSDRGATAAEEGPPSDGHGAGGAAGSRLPDLGSLRARLGELETRVETAAASATARLRELAVQEASGQHARDLLQAAARLLPALRERLGTLAALRDALAGRHPLDAFGMDRELFEQVTPLLEFLYTTWWRVEPRRIDNVPADGPVMVVANHGGTLPWDALVLRLALLRDHPSPRDLRPVLDEHALRLPIAGTVALRLGAVPATPENVLRLLEAGGATAVFPEGSRAGRRPWPQRYRIERFGRGGFAKLAFRTGAAVVPCAIVGSEETSAPFARAGWLADALGMPILTGAPALPLAPLGLFPLPSRWSLRFGEPIETRAAGAGAADDPPRVLELTERVRASLQQMLDEDVAARRSVYL